MLMTRQLAYHLALKMLPATHQDSGEFIFQQDCHSSQNLVREYVFYVFFKSKKRDFLRFFEVAFQKT